MIRSLISQILNSPYVDSFVEVYVDDCLMTNKNHSSVGDQVHVALFFVEICIAKQIINYSQYIIYSQTRTLIFVLRIPRKVH